MYISKIMQYIILLCVWLSFFSEPSVFENFDVFVCRYSLSLVCCIPLYVDHNLVTFSLMGIRFVSSFRLLNKAVIRSLAQVFCKYKHSLCDIYPEMEFWGSQNVHILVVVTTTELMSKVVDDVSFHLQCISISVGPHLCHYLFEYYFFPSFSLFSFWDGMNEG